MKALQARYGKDRQKLQQETMALYRSHGVSPAGCLLPMLIQMPVLIGLYNSINLALASLPEGLMGLSSHLYAWLPQSILQAVPLDSRFLWLDLGRPDPLFILPVLVGVSTWVQSKMSAMPTADAQQESMNRMMTTMMPLMLGYTTVLFASGLALYWVMSNVVGVVIQYFVTGWGGLGPLLPWVPKTTSTTTTGATDAQQQPQPGNNGQDGRRGRRAGTPSARRTAVRSRNRRS
jgi:YidC/Oxa1 family membrane protein insertase